VELNQITRIDPLTLSRVVFKHNQLPSIPSPYPWFDGVVYGDGKMLPPRPREFRIGPVLRGYGC
jgi:hypothetical protein